MWLPWSTSYAVTVKGRSAMLRARLIASVTLRWWRAQLPLMRRGTTLPRSRDEVLERLRVLVVDDERLVRAELADALRGPRRRPGASAFRSGVRPKSRSSSSRRRCGPCRCLRAVHSSASSSSSAAPSASASSASSTLAEAVPRQLRLDARRSGSMRPSWRSRDSSRSSSSGGARGARTSRPRRRSRRPRPRRRCGRAPSGTSARRRARRRLRSISATTRPRPRYFRYT